MYICVCACVCFIGPILLDNVGCRGNESSLLQCSHRGIGVYRSCSHYEDAGVRCTGKNVSNKKGFPIRGMAHGFYFHWGGDFN